MKSFLNKYSISPEIKIVIACSGGADSMFLLHRLLEIHPKNNIIVAHFNHELRGKESDRDESFVRDFCVKNGLTFELGNADIKNLAKEQKLGIEEAARNARYHFLENIRQIFEARYIFTAHHLDDSIETFLFNLIRGTKLTGLSGIEENNSTILRPLLHIQKGEILAQCKEKNITFITDSTNLEDTALRNHIRINIVPEFKKINPNYGRAFDRVMTYFGEVQDFLDSQAIHILDENTFSVRDFRDLSPILRKELLRHLFDLTNNGTIGLSEGNLSELERFILDARGGTIKELKRLRLTKRQIKITFDKMD